LDSLTQIVLGAAVAEAVAGKKMGNKAALWGALAGTIPDLDVFFMALFHPIDAALVHRGISHSLLFALGMGPLLGWLFFHMYKKKYNLSTWIWLFFLGIVTHPMLDMFTNYGTSFLWPLPLRITFNSVFVIDPLYTVPFMILLIWALCLRRDNPKRKRLNWAGIVYSTAYLMWGVIVKLSILSTSTDYFTSNGYREQLKTSIVTPMPFTSFYWMVMVEDDSAYYIGYKSIFYPFDPTQVDTIPKNHSQLETLKWSGKNYSKQLSFISNSLYTTAQSSNQTYFYDLRFGVLSQLTARKMNDPMMGFSLISQGDQVVRVERKRPNGSFQSFDFSYYWHQLFVGQHPSN
jgi:inner membrane protein